MAPLMAPQKNSKANLLMPSLHPKDCANIVLNPKYAWEHFSIIGAMAIGMMTAPAVAPTTSATSFGSVDRRPKEVMPAALVRGAHDGFWTLLLCV